MAKGDVVVGLDIGTTKVCTIIGEVAGDNGRVDVLGVGVAPSSGLRRGVVVSIEETVSAIRESVARAQRMAGAEVHSAVVGVTGEHFSSLNSRGVVAITHPDREVTESDVDRVLENSRVIVLPPDREIVHAIPRGFSLDGQNGIRSPVGMSGTRLEVETHIVTGATSFLRNVITCVDRANLQVDELVLEPIATADSVVMAAEKDLGVVLVDIGGGTSDIAVFRGGEICYSAVVPIGGVYVTRDIAAVLRTTPEEAERVKLASGVAVAENIPPDKTFSFTHVGTDEQATESVKLLAEIIEPRARELFTYVRQELLRSGYADILPAGMVLSGGGAMLAGLRDVAADITGMPARIGFPGGVGGLTESVSAPSFATAVGLVRWGGRMRAHIPRPGGATGLLGALRVWMHRITTRSHA